jgi:hypothetical protein
MKSPESSYIVRKFYDSKANCIDVSEKIREPYIFGRFNEARR